MASVERYDPYPNSWQLMESVGMPAFPKNMSVVALDGLIYVIGMERVYVSAGLYVYRFRLLGFLQFMFTFIVTL